MIYINCDDNPHTWNKKNYLMAAQKRLGLHVFEEYRVGLGDVDCLLNIEPCGVLMGKKWSGLWHIDAYLNNTYTAHYANMDNVFLATNLYIPKELEHKCTTLFQAADPELHRRLWIPHEYDFVLCGSAGAGVYQDRSDAFELLKTKFTYHDFGKDHPPAEYVKNINTARVQFIRTGSNNGNNGNAAQRFFECLAIGPVLTNYTDDLPLTGLVEDEDYMAYRTPEEMMEKMQELIDDAQLRNFIAFNGRRKAMLYHTYDHRLISIINTVNEHLSRATL